MPPLDSKNIGLAILPAIIAAVLGGSTLISFIISAFLTPNMTIDFAIDRRNLSEAEFDIKNTGNAAAKNVILTIQAPYSVAKHTIFSTENYTERISPNLKSLEVHVPRFVQGGGSLTKIDTVMDDKSNIMSGEYRIYITYDQGSVSRIIPILQRPLTFSEIFSGFWQQYGTTISYLAAFVAFVPSAWLFLRYLRRRVSIKEIVPKQIRLQPENNLLTILGSNFGSHGTVWIERYRLPHDDQVKTRYQYQKYSEQLEEQFKLTVVTREDNRIIVNLDDIKEKLKAQEYIVRVEKDGLLTHINSDAEFRIIEL